MPFNLLGKRKRDTKHPYLTGNFAPQKTTCPLTPCTFTGSIPPEFSGGQYVRNGSNPVSNEDLGRDAHWFDGDGMLSGVSFARTADHQIQPEFVNQYILTDVFLSAVTTPSLKRPILPSIATLVNPLCSLLKICLSILRAVFLVFLSRLPGSKQTVKKISVANTAIMYHDGRALATCESGPPMRVSLPSLDTVGWYNGLTAEGEPPNNVDGPVLGGQGLLSWMREWTTAHPKVDPDSNEMLLFHSTPMPPFVNYSIIPAEKDHEAPVPSRLLNAPVAGVSSAKMMHDFGVSARHTVIMDLPLSLDALQLAKGQPIISYDSSKPSRFGVFPRRDPSNVRWFETSACCIFHTVNTWDVTDRQGTLQSVDMMACRLTSANLVFSAGNIAAPQPTRRTALNVAKAKYMKSQDVSSPYEKSPLIEKNPSEPGLADMEEEQCRLYYYSFDMTPSDNRITHQYSLSKIPFEFPSVHPDREMSNAIFVYGCTSTVTTFNSALGRASKIDALVKFNARSLIERGRASPPRSVTGCVDNRSVAEVLACQGQSSTPDDIQIFRPPPNIYCQEPRFVPATNAKSEDEGYLVFYTFDERQLLADGEPSAGATSELWIIDAGNMEDIVARIQLPQRVPYGLHGSWFPERQVLGQRPAEKIRQMPSSQGQKEGSLRQRAGGRVIKGLIGAIGG